MRAQQAAHRKSNRLTAGCAVGVLVLTRFTLGALAQCLSRSDTAGRGDVTTVAFDSLPAVHAELEDELAILQEARCFSSRSIVALRPVLNEATCASSC